MTATTTAPAPVEAPPLSTNWGSLALTLVAGLYVWVSVWLVVVAAVPAVALGWEPTVVTSGSMAPVIRAGDIVLLRDVDPHTLAPGTVVAFDDPDRPGSRVLHRIIGVHPDGSYRTKGDANAVPDSTPVPAERIQGAGVLLVPFLGLPLRWLTTAPLLALGWFVATGMAMMLTIESGATAATTAADRRARVGSRLARLRRPSTSSARAPQREPVVRTVRPAGLDDRRTPRSRRRDRGPDVDDPRSER